MCVCVCVCVCVGVAQAPPTTDPVCTCNLIAGSIHNEYDFGVSKDGYKTIVYLKLIYTLKIYAIIASDRIHYKYYTG